MFRFILDGIELSDHPQNWKEYKSSISYNEEFRTFLITKPTSLIFWGQAYTHIQNKFYNNEICDKMTFVVYDDNVKITDGYIMVTDCVLDLDKKTVTAEVIDNNYQLQIDNNKEIKCSLGSNETKNSTADAPIYLNNPATSYRTNMVFELTTGGVQSVFVQGYDLFDVFTHLVEFMSDNEMSFASDWYNNLDVDKRIFVSNGYGVRDETTARPYLSFYDLHQTISKIYGGLNIIIEGSVLRIEDDSYLLNPDNISLTITDARNIQLEIDQSKLHSRVKLGNNKNRGSWGTQGRSPKLPLIGWWDEEYHVQVECNTDVTLDLNYEYITEPSKIYDASIDGDTTNDDEIFLIQYTDGGAGPAGFPQFTFDSQTNWKLFNEEFMNYKIAERWDFLGTIAKLLGTTTSAIFEAGNSGLIKTFNSNVLSTTTQSVYSMSDTFDPNNVWDSVNHRFTPPQDGVYYLQALFYLDLTGTCPEGVQALYAPDFYVEMTINHRSSAGSVLNSVTTSYTFNDLPRNPNIINRVWCGQGPSTSSTNSRLTLNEWVPATFSMDSTDYVDMYYQIKGRLDGSSSPNVIVEFKPIIKCVNQIVTSGRFEVSNASNNYIGKLTFDKSINQNEVQTIINNPTYGIRVETGEKGNNDYINQVFFINNVEVNHLNGRSSFNLRSTDKIFNKQ